MITRIYENINKCEGCARESDRIRPDNQPNLINSKGSSPTMPESIERECLHCGMLHLVSLPDFDERATEQFCDKCDSPLFQQSDGSTLTIDIAHHRETVAQALQKLESALTEGWHGYASQVRLIVGGGVIREAVLAELYFQQSKNRILNFIEEGGNRGAVLVRIR
jgi:hypothetical protein